MLPPNVISAKAGIQRMRSMHAATTEIFEIASDADYQAVLDRVLRANADDDAERLIAEKTAAARAIVEDVRNRGDAAVAEYTARFDRVTLRPDQFEVSPDEVAAAVKQVDSALLDALRRAHENIRYFHSKNLRQSWQETQPDGTVLGQRITPIESAGVYVPGGTAFYPSSVLMNIVPAHVAGVREIVMVSPPSYEGGIHPVVLAAAAIAGAHRVFRVGGAQAIAALAYGTQTIPQTLKITGPGNTFVTVAKRLVQSVCAIDTEAGPSEVTVIADDSADPQRVAAELLAQAEHDVEASSILLTPSRALAERVVEVIDAELQTLSRASIIRQSLAARGAIIVTRDLDEALRLSNLIAPEHLAVYTRNPMADLDKITNAGSIMVGEPTSVVWGDYIAGPNHILPTGRRARFASPLSAEDFRKVSSVIAFSDARAKACADDVCRMATAEKLTAHARAAELRK